MLTNSKNIEIAEVFKNYKGWGSTHANRELFEELFRAFNKVSTESILTYGSLIPRTPEDKLYANVVNLAPNTTYVYPESNFSNVPLIEYVAELPLTAVSGNCNDAYVIKRDSKQVENIIPFDFSDTGIYNYTLKTEAGEEIAFGVCDWRVDVNSAILTFNNGVPEGVSADHPPKLTFYRYAGPTGIKSHLDAVFKTVAGVQIVDGEPVVKFTESLNTSLDEVKLGWFEEFGFNGDDSSQGVGLQFNTLTPVTDSATGDVLKGWDEASKSQVVSLLTHKTSNNSSVLFVSEGLSGTQQFVINSAGLQKVDLDDGFLVGNFEPGDYEIEVTESNDIYAVLLAKNNDTFNYDLYIPRSDEYVDVQVPIFVDVSILPAHLKLTSMTTYGDQIVPQYYGPRVVDFVIASETSVDNRSADYIVYNNEGSFLAEGLAKATGHTLLRNGAYVDSGNLVTLEDIHLQGESEFGTQVAGTFEINGVVVLSDLDLSDTTIKVNEGAILELKNVNVGTLENNGTTLIFNSNIEEYTETEDSNLEAHNSYIRKCTLTGKSLILSSHIGWLDAELAKEETVIEATAVDYLNSFEGQFKLDLSFVSKVNDSIDSKLYPAAKTITYYNAFNERFFAKLSDPIDYDEDTNEIIIKLDLGEEGVRRPTIFVNEDGRLQVRIFDANEIGLNSDLIKTQTESTAYDEASAGHEDTVLETERPVNVEEAILDLYWSKAGLVNGKLPLKFLPDSVAHGGIKYVGMWPFEQEQDELGNWLPGEYPTFDKIDKHLITDDKYEKLQPGWFMIVSASHKDDDPCLEQIAIDGEKFTAGDWLIYAGTVTKPVIVGYKDVPDKKKVIVTRKYVEDFTSEGLLRIINNTPFQYKGMDETYTYFNKNDWEVCTEDPNAGGVHGFVHDMQRDSVEGTEVLQLITKDKTKFASVYVGYVLNSEGEKIKAVTFNGMSADMTESFMGFVVREDNISSTSEPLADYNRTYEAEEYEDYIRKDPVYEDRTFDKWDKLDRSYSDPVYSRLPVLATDSTKNINPEWSVLDGGTGLLRLSNITLAEAIRLINEELLQLGPQAPASIKDISLVIDDKTTTGITMEYMPAVAGQLDNLIADFDNNKKVAYISGSGLVGIKQVGKHKGLPLEREFYVSDTYDFEIMDGGDIVYSTIDAGTGSSLEIANLNIDVQDPYQKYKLGVNGPSNFKSADVDLDYDLVSDEVSVVHKIKYSVVNQSENVFVEDLTEFEGSTGVVEFEERQINDFSLAEVETCKSINAGALNDAMIKIGGVKFLTTEFDLTGSFKIKNFITNGAISRKDKVEIFASLGSFSIDVKDLHSVLTKTGNGVFDLEVRFTVGIPNREEVFGIHDLTISTNAYTYDGSIEGVEVLRLQKLNIAPTGINLNVLDSPLSGWPEYTTDFNDTYKKLTVENSWELTRCASGWCWPEGEYVTEYKPNTEAVLQTVEPTGFDSGDYSYRFITICKDLGEIYDMCGFDLLLSYGKEEKPIINKLNGQFTNMMVQVLVTSSEAPHTQFLDGNKAVPIFYKSDFTLGAAALYPGKSNEEVRRITFGNKPVPVSKIIVRIGVPKDSNICIKNVDFNLNIE